MERYYIRNGVPGWSVQEQLDELPDLTGASVHQDTLQANRAKHPSRVKPEWLERRNNDLLRQNSPRSEEIITATPLVLAVSEVDMMRVLPMAWKRGATVRFVDSGLTLPPDAGEDGINAAVDAWQEARKAVRTKPGRVAGYIAAAEKKRADTKRKLRVAKPLWKSTDPDRLTADQIAVKAELSVKTLYRELHDRPRRRIK